MTFRHNPEAAAARTLHKGAGDATPIAPPAEAREGWPDDVIMQAVVNGDQVAFTVLYDRYVDLVYSTCLRVLANPAAAEDTTQDVFVRLWRKPETFVAERGRFLSWLVSVSRNRAVDELRARGRRRRREEMPTGDDTLLGSIPSAPDDDPALTAQAREEQHLVRRALSGLPADQRRALELAYFGGLTQQEIAVRLHEPLGTVKTRIRLGMQKLRRALQDRV
jgi:RNA polymerase sigma-70 factor (ECF subfamily)